MKEKIYTAVCWPTNEVHEHITMKVLSTPNICASVVFPLCNDNKVESESDNYVHLLVILCPP